MNTLPQDQPEWTQYALGEMPPAESHWIESQLAAQPELQREVAEIQNLAATLQAEAPFSDLRLTSAQRRRVLSPPARKPLAPTPRPPQWAHRRRIGFGGAIWRIAAVVTLSCASFWLGLRGNPEALRFLVELTPTTGGEENSPQLVEVSAHTEALQPAERVAAAEPEAAAADLVMPVPEPESSSPTVASTSGPEMEDKGNAVIEAPAVITIAGSPPSRREQQARDLTEIGVSELGGASEFISVIRQSADKLVLRPHQLQPVLPAARGATTAMHAKPQTPGEKKAAIESKRRGKPELFIHAWNADLAVCPWNPEHRLLRLTVQLPASQQAAAHEDLEYPFEVTFNTSTVREFRRLASRHFPAEDAERAGRQVVWYEFQPNSLSPAGPDNHKRIATLEMPSVRFTTQPVGPFDNTRLQVLDRGQSWDEAQEAFRFEAAVVGMGLLLDGKSGTANLNQRLVLNLAEKAKGADPDGSRARFINGLRQIGRFTGRQ